MSLRYAYFNVDDPKQSRITIQLWDGEELRGAIFLRRESNLPDDPEPYTRCWQVAGIDVLEPFRRQGYGTKLYEEAARQAQKQGLTLCSDTIADMATPALAFWEKQVQKKRAYWEVPGPAEREGHNYDYGRFVLKTPTPPTLSGAGEQKKYDLPACVKARQGKKVNPNDYREIFEISEQWGEVTHWKDWDWYLIKDVPISELEYSTLDEYEGAAETDPEEEAWENIDRVNEIIRILQAGEPRWPVILGRDCGVLDGYHRISASNELGMTTIDVLYPVRKGGGSLSGHDAGEVKPELPDVGREFFVSPAAPPHLKKLTTDLLWYLYSPDKGGQIDEYGMWDMGGCRLLAQALHDRIPGSSMHWLVGTDPQWKERGPIPQHVVTKVDRFYLDGNGIYTENELLDWWRDYEKFSALSLKPFDADEATALSVRCPVDMYGRLVRDLEKYL